MVLAFFKGSSNEGDFEHIVTRSISMLADARHSFDLATLALLTEADPASVAEDIRNTDQRINEAEQDLRSELIVHVSVKGGADIGSVLGFTLLLKKIERIGDQAKNILELSEAGVQLS
ncbi:MAG: PhoU domain-containing protein, partial [Acidimicrobiales bacterium]